MNKSTIVNPDELKDLDILTGIEVFKAADLIDREIDESKTLLGSRFLCRGGGMTLIGPSGVGKSTLTLGLSSAMGSGKPFLGINPVQKLKVFIIQAENDEGDMIEQTQGAYGSDREGIENVFIAKISHLTGEKFIETVAALIRRHTPDIIILDCLHAYLGGDVKESEKITHFLRELLTPLIERYGVGVIIIHHTPKTTNQDRTNWNPSDYQYAAAGSAELTNWSRSILVLEATAIPGVFRLVAAKRASRLDKEVWKDLWIPICHGTCDSSGNDAPLRWQIAKDVDLGTIKRATIEKRASKLSYQCTPGDFIAQLPETGEGMKSCMKSGALRQTLKDKKMVAHNSFKDICEIHEANGIIKTYKLGREIWIGRPDDIEEIERNHKREGKP